MNHYIKVDENSYITHYVLADEAPEGFIQVDTALNICEVYDPETGTSAPEEQV